jgi:methyl-accepting chemotaxis protein
MLGFFNDIRIRTRLLLALLIPVIGFIAASSYILLEKNVIHREAGSVRALSAFATQISNLVHELQKERGASALFMGSKGTQFAPELAAQRKESDLAFGKFKNAVDKLDVGKYGTDFSKNLNESQTALSSLFDGRKGIDVLSTEPSAAIVLYTKTISELIEIVAGMTGMSGDARITNIISAYVQILHAKERAGQERATGAAGFSSGKFSPALHARFIALGAEQENLLELFRDFASAEEAKFLKQTLSGTAVDEVVRLRKIAIESLVSGDLGGVQAQHWFKAATDRIDLMRKVEDRMSTDILDLAAKIEGEAKTSLIVVSIALLVSFGLLLLLVPMIVGSITGPIGEMTSVMNELASGQLEVEVKGTEHKAETGDMARSVLVFQSNARENRRMQAEQEELKRQSEIVRRQAMLELADRFEDSVKDVIKSVAASASEMQAAAQSVSQNADTTSRQATSVASAAEQASNSVQTVAAAAEEMAASIREISSQVASSPRSPTLPSKRLPGLTA